MATKVKQALDRLLSDIRRGEYGPDEMWQIMTACSEKVLDGSFGTRWRIEAPAFAVSVTEDDITLTEVAAVKRRTGQLVQQMNPAADPTLIGEIVRARMVESMGSDPDRVDAQLRKVTLNEALAWYSEFPVGADPKDQPENDSVPPEG